MFENMTYENILNDMLSRVTTDVDKREGSIIFDAIAPCAYKLAENYFLLNNFIDLIFADTAVGEYLDRIVEVAGISRKQATKSVRLIETNTEVALGSRFALEDTTYIVIERISATSYKAECEQFGEIGSTYQGALTNLDNINNLTASLTSILITGVEKESDIDLRTRYYSKVKLPSTSGNIYDYKKWALEVAGVGDCHVIPLWSGPGTVKVIIVDSNREINNSLESKVHEHIEMVRPIGAEVTVVSPTPLNLNISATIEISQTKSLEEIKEQFRNDVENYLKESIFNISTISYAKIGSILLNVAGVNDYTNLLVNEAASNIVVGSDEAAVLNSINLTEV